MKAFTPDEALRVTGALAKLPGGWITGAVIRNLDDLIAAVEQYAAHAQREEKEYRALQDAHGQALWNAIPKD